MEKATKIAEIEGMLLDCCGPALRSAVWDIFKPSPRPTLHLVIYSCPPIQPRLAFPVQPISSILFLSLTGNNKKGTEGERGREKYSERTARGTKVLRWRNQQLWVVGCMLRDLMTWNVNTKWRILILFLLLHPLLSFPPPLSPPF